MARREANGWLRRIRQWFLAKLEEDHPAYEQRICNNLERLYATIRKGDVVLVEGRSKMSALIKLFSHSHWSHVAYYVGDTLIAEDAPNRHRYKLRFGDDAAHLLVEAYTGQGVTVDSLAKYRNHNIRICRPYGIKPHHLEAVSADIIAHIGRRYDDRNVFNMALMVLAGLIQPHRRQSHRERLSSGNRFEVICSGMISRAFQKVGYPIVPALDPLPVKSNGNHANPYGAKLLMRHYSQIMPRDFDLSPNFEVLKYNLLGQSFDYETLWQEKSD